ncbi:54S ribosomal protein L7, mitochondrial [Recurvomyces mirabilis]|nr:54S ribosomal protein L7, mitochondrial [Recurvomyces mirabilis]
MALQEVTSAFLKRFSARPSPLQHVWAAQCRHASTNVETGQETQGMETSDFSEGQNGGGKDVGRFDPAGVARKRGRKLPPSRYQFRSPRYYRGPLHPHQPLKPSDPASREFEAGPFSLPRLEQTYHDTLASDYMVMAYQHHPPGYEAPKKGDRLRPWVGDSPYYKNRPLRGPRGGDVLKLLRKPITFRNVPQLERVTVHTMVKGAIDDGAYLHVAGMVLQAITNMRAESHAAKRSVAGFGIRAGQHLSLTCDLRGETMYHFLSKLVDVVLPKIKDWPGVKGSSGDSSGDIALGLRPEDMTLFPEIEVNYDMYPPRMIPGCHIIIHTSATNEQDARVLLSQIGIPFYGKLIN